MKIRDATAADLPEILAIYNDAVLTTTAIWNENVVDVGKPFGFVLRETAVALPCLGRRRGG